MDSESLRLTDAELAVIRQHLDLDQRPVSGETSSDESALLAEGFRSLVARKLCRVDDEGVALSTELVEATRSLLAPQSAVTLTRLSGEAASIGFGVLADDQFIAHRPVVAGVHEFRTIGRDQLVEVLAAGILSEEAPRPEAWQVHALVAGDSAVFTVGVDEEGNVALLDAEGNVEETLTSDDMRQRIHSLLEGSLAQ